jgi:hypothetical protein
MYSYIDQLGSCLYVVIYKEQKSQVALNNYILSDLKEYFVFDCNSLNSLLARQ